MRRRAEYWLWRFRIWWNAHLLPEWHRFYQAEIAKRAKSHKARAKLQTEYTRRVHAELKRELGK
jgi:hypothetical protein